MHYFNRSLLSTVLALSSATALAAQNEDHNERSWMGGALLLDLDNDAITNQDGHFTSAINLTWQSDALTTYQQDHWCRSIDRWTSGLPGFSQRENRRLSFGLSQYIFTPGSIKEPVPDPNDMPYTGVLFARATLSAQNDGSLIAAGIRLGVSGPPSLGERLQKSTHAIIGVNQPIGWEYQVGTEVLLNIEAHYRHRTLRFGNGSWRGDLITDGSLQAGTMLGMGSLGATLRWGWRLPNDFYINPIFMSDSTIGIRSGLDQDPQWRVYGLASVSGKVISNAIFLNGNTYKYSRSVDFDPLAAQATFAIIVQYNNFRTGASVTATTVPWENPDELSINGYGRFTFGYSF